MATDWGQTDSGLGATLTVENDDYFKIAGTPNAVGDEYTYYTNNAFTNFSTTLYPKLVVRWKTDAIALGLEAKIKVVYTVGETFTTLGFSSAWKTTVIDLTASKIVDSIQLWADDNPDTAESYGAHYVMFDFIMACGGVFTFPNCAGGLQFTPPSRYGMVQIPERIGDVSQYAGADSATVESTSYLDIGNWKRTSDTVNGDVFLDIAHNSYKEPFQWLDTGTERFKATLEKPVFRREVNGSKTQHMLDLAFKEYRRCSGSNETFRERFHSEGTL